MWGLFNWGVWVGCNVGEFGREEFSLWGVF